MPSLPARKDGECDSCSHQCETCKSAYIPLFKPPLKELPAGEGLTLFGWVATPDLAGFHNIKLILLCKLKYIDYL